MLILDTDTEVWKPIKGFEGLYEISNFGRLRSLDRYVLTHNGQKRFYKGKVFLLKSDKSGYVLLKISNGGVKKYDRIHRVVAEHFIPNPENKPEVNHIDGNKSNNHFTNLEWATLSENRKHAFDIGLAKKGQDHHHAKFSNEDIIKIREMGSSKMYTHDYIAAQFNVCRTIITRIINRKRWSQV